MLRIIREEEPPRPSTRLQHGGDAAGDRGRPRHRAGAADAGWCAGELDWIVMKALEKDRDRRYETANGFARGRASATWRTSRWRRARRRRGTGCGSLPDGTGLAWRWQ